ncbi:UDP-N-acetylglucosamine 2-epimerase [Pseudoalteromonas luteoviolacea]|uniref:UDP-N-acetylglucosamine 2-epimerase n=1 Tax=Pseudoalteromonas luteoviolacea TaxID=43657 RepID=UPI001B369151|nr:UDP-N-acetylglucosamine 2-epimerase [Pseudoalteromonas luteoviolacea]MBQ4838268.1 UDP-N-acetylglucosamine 2-epimerase (hydrolyzing) [Pseudoalteromonas luteoviolacea]
MKVALVTSTRADFGLLLPLIQKLEADPSFSVSILATGSHTDSSRGDTLQEVHNEGIQDLHVIEVDTNDTSDVGVAVSAAHTLEKFSTKFEELKPDLVVLLGDRYEILSVTMAAFLLKLPIAHISGGDVTTGALDDSIRHSITKLSHIHFPTTEEYRQRVIQLGEQPDRVFNVGNLCIDNVKMLEKVELKELEQFLEFDLNRFKQNILVTLHPETTRDNQASLNDAFFNALAQLEDVGIIITYPNHDAGGDTIIESIQNLKRQKGEAVCVRESLGMRRYHSLLTHVNAVVGNSSSGITEVPSYGIPTVDVGDRQQGRIRAESVINVDYGDASIQNAITLALGEKMQHACLSATNPYGDGNTAERIVETLKRIETNGLIKKVFYDA